MDGHDLYQFKIFIETSKIILNNLKIYRNICSFFRHLRYSLCQQIKLWPSPNNSCRNPYYVNTDFTNDHFRNPIAINNVVCGKGKTIENRKGGGT